MTTRQAPPHVGLWLLSIGGRRPTVASLLRSEESQKKAQKTSELISRHLTKKAIQQCEAD
eukprot:scaffold25198_cov20-Prasinocladus_malaysianus.AAC.1